MTTQTLDNPKLADNGGDNLPPNITPVKFSDDDNERETLLAYTRCKVALLLAASRLGVDYATLSVTKRGYYAGIAIEEGRYKEAAQLLDSMNALDLKHFAPEFSQ